MIKGMQKQLGENGKKSVKEKIQLFFRNREDYGYLRNSSGKRQKEEMQRKWISVADLKRLPERW